jgi:hypothetical protein
MRPFEDWEQKDLDKAEMSREWHEKQKTNKIMHLLVSYKEDGVYLHGIFDDKEIKTYRKLANHCYVIPLNKFIEDGMILEDEHFNYEYR